MPITVTGYTDTTGAVSIVPMVEKTVCIVAHGVGLTTPLPDGVEPDLKVFNVLSTSDVIRNFGPTSKAVNMAKVLIKNGVTTIKAIRVPDAGDTKQYATQAEAFAAAFDVLLTDDVDLLSLDTFDTAVLNKLKDHLDMAESEDKFRYAVMSVAGVNVEQYVTLATSINHSRVFMVGPSAVDDNADPVGPEVLACGVTAAIIKEMKDPALPLNGVEMLGFGGVQSVLNKPGRDVLINGGVTPIVKSPSGRPTIYRLVTTYTKDTQGSKDPIWQEGTTRFIADHVLASCQARIRTNYKRTKNVIRILNAMKTDIVDVLSKLDGLEIIENFDKATVTVRKDPTDLYGAIIEYEFDVVTPLYTVTIRQHMKL